jgi:DNA-binding CsgD family transcriptional regulator
LTKREWQCLYWLAQGKTLEETAIILGIALRTIKAHVINIKEKFNCSNQFQLGMLYQHLRKAYLLENP